MPQKTKQMLKKTLIVTMPLWGFALLVLAKQLYAAWVMPYMPPCILRTFTGLLCPSCGMTHAVFALCRGDIAAAWRYNALIPLAVLLFLIWYAELLMGCFGRAKKIIPRRPVFWFTVLGMVLFYAVLRNII